jgi:hypothetical protein
MAQPVVVSDIRMWLRASGPQVMIGVATEDGTAGAGVDTWMMAGPAVAWGAGPSVGSAVFVGAIVGA